MSKQWWTVSAIYADTQESYVEHVQAEDVAAAKTKAYREAESVITIAAVFAGRLMAEEEPSSDITPLHGRGHTLTVTQLSMVERKIVLPSRCPKCKADLRKPHSVLQGDLSLSKWGGHLTKSGDGLSAEKNQEMRVVGRPLYNAVKIRCVTCNHDLWNGAQKAGV